MTFRINPSRSGTRKGYANPPPSHVEFLSFMRRVATNSKQLHAIQDESINLAHSIGGKYQVSLKAFANHEKERLIVSRAMFFVS